MPPVAHPVAATAMPRTAVVGAGAVGCYFGAMLARAGAAVTLIGRAGPMKAIAADGLTIVGRDDSLRQPLGTATDPSGVADARLVLVCTKTNDTTATAAAIRPHLHPQAAVLSLQNGVDNADRIAAAIGRPALAAAVYVAVEMTAPGRLAHRGRGDLAIGIPGTRGGLAADGVADDATDDAVQGAGARVREVARWFEQAGVPCRVSDDVRVDLWTKLVMNCAVNALSALGQVPYGKMAEHDEIRTMIAGLVDETVAVARADGVPLPPDDHVAAAFRLIEAMAGQYSSTAQDIRKGKPTEIDALNGHVAALAQRHGLQAPLNRWLTALVKLRERSDPAG